MIRDLLSGGLLVLVLLAAPARGRAAPDAAQDTLRLSLEDCISRALGEGEEMKIAEADYAGAHALYLQARSTALPQLDLNSSYTRQLKSALAQETGPEVKPFQPDTTAPIEQRVRDLEKNLPTAGLAGLGQLFSSSAFASKNSWVATLSLRQKLIEGGSIWNSIAGSRHALRSTEKARSDKREEVVLNVREAYLAALLAERGVRIAELGLAQAESQLQRVQLRHDAGNASEFELLQAQVQRDNQVPNVTQARSLREVAYLELARLTNVPSAARVRLTTPILDDAAVPMNPTQVDTAGLVDLALKSAGIDALQEAVEARGHAVTVAAASKWPSLSLFGSYSEQAYPSDGFPSSGQWLQDARVGAQLDWHLFDGLRTKGAVQQAKADRERQYLGLRQTQKQVREAVIQSRWDLLRAADELTARSRTVELARKAYDLSSLRYDEGATSLLEVQDARIAYQIAQTNEAQARHDYFVALARLERYSGRPLFTSAVPNDAGQHGRPESR